MAGMRPVVELMYLDFLGVCFDQILNQAAKMRFMTGGKARMGLTIRTQFGGGRSSGSQHSQSLEALLAHVPGLTVVMPSTPADTYGLLRAAIARPEPGRVHREQAAVRRQGPEAAGRLHRAARQGEGGAAGDGRDDRERLPDGRTRPWPPPSHWPATGSAPR